MAIIGYSQKSDFADAGTRRRFQPIRSPKRMYTSLSPNMNIQNNTDNTIKIWQQNIRKSWDAQMHTIHMVGNMYNIICLQEPHFDFQKLTRATSVWRVVLPSLYNTRETQERWQAPRAAILVHERVSTNGWTQVDIASQDVVAIHLTTHKAALNVYNMYNDCTHSETLQVLKQHLQKREADEINNTTEGQMEGDLWVGDFNRHHPMWENARNSRLFMAAALDEAQELIELLADYDMAMSLPQGIPTIRNSRGNLTRPDNVFISNAVSDWVIKCNTTPEDQPPTADHFLIVITLDMPVTRNKNTPALNYRATDWGEFRTVLTRELAHMPKTNYISTKEELDKALNNLETAILNTAKEVVPRRKPSPYAKQWWTKELSQLRQETRKKVRQANKLEGWPLHSVHVEARNAKTRYTDMVKKTKTEHWEDWLEGITAKSI